MTDGRLKLKSDGNVVIGAALIVLSAACFTLGGYAIKVLSRDLNPVALVFWRNLLSAWLILFWFSWRGFPSLATAHPLNHALRAIFTFGGLLCFFAAIAAVPLANAVLLRSANPLFVPLLSLLIYGRQSDRNVWFGVALGFAGVVCVVGPDLNGWSLSTGELAGIAAGALGGAAAVSIWSLSGRDSPATQMAYFSVLSVVVSVLPMPWFWQLPGMALLPELLWIAVFTTLAQAFLASGLAAAPADKILSWGYMAVAFAALAGYLGWGETLPIAGIVGIVLVVVGSHWASRPVKSG
ncbi:MAG: DMT family transporter [Hyphomicrobiaceae bacterium]